MPKQPTSRDRLVFELSEFRRENRTGFGLLAERLETIIHHLEAMSVALTEVSSGNRHIL